MREEEEAKKLQEFIKHLDNTKEELLDSLYINGKKYDEKFNLTLTTNGQTITIPMDADVWSNIQKLVREKLNEI